MGNLMAYAFHRILAAGMKRQRLHLHVAFRIGALLGYSIPVVCGRPPKITVQSALHWTVILEDDTTDTNSVDSLILLTAMQR